MIETFDTIAWLDDAGIRYQAEGKNVSEGWIGINCLFCADPSYHLGINLQSNRYSCWRCSAVGSVVKLIMRHSRIPYSHAQAILYKYQDPTAIRTTPLQIPEGILPAVDFPEGSQKELPALHWKWLMKRDFSPDFISKHYNIHALNLHDKWPFRLVIPIYYHHLPVTFVGCDVTGEADPPYENYPTAKSVVSAKHTLYNIDRVGHTAIVVEGITDVWRLGDGVVATMGTKWTISQAKQLMGLKAAFVMFDAEKQAQKQAHRLAAVLTSGVRKVEVLELSEGDPNDLPPSTVQALKREIFGRK